MYIYSCLRTCTICIMYEVQYYIGIDEIESLTLLDRLVRDVLVLGKAGFLFHIGNSSVKLLILMDLMELSISTSH